MDLTQYLCQDGLCGGWTKVGVTSITLAGSDFAALALKLIPVNT